MEVNEFISSGLIELYVLGMTNEQETAQVLAMANQYREVKNEITDIEICLEHYAKVHAVNPSIKLKEKVFNTLVLGKPQAEMINTAKLGESKVVPISSFWKYVAAASVILLIGSIVFNLNYSKKLEQANSELANARNLQTTAEQKLAALEKSNDDMKKDMYIVQSKFSEPHVLNGMPQAPAEAKAKIFWMKNTGEVYIDPSNLPDAPQGMQYQFWAIVDGKPVDGGLIIINSKDDKYHIHKMKSFGRAEAFAVTLETAGGNPEPKGQMYVMGKL